MNSGTDSLFQGISHIWEGSIWGYPTSLRISGVWWQKTTSILGVQRPEGSICEGRMPPQKPRNCSNATPSIPWGPCFTPNQEGRRNQSSKKSGITTLKWLLARGEGQRGTWGNPSPLQPSRVEVAEGTCLAPGRPWLATTHPYPAQGSPEGEHPNSHNSCPRTPVP